MKIQHFGRRLLHDKANVIYTRVELKNKDDRSHQLKLLLNGNNVAERVFETGDFNDVVCIQVTEPDVPFWRNYHFFVLGLFFP